MPAPRRLSEYIKAAFNARPAGMFVAPNWVGLAAFGLLGLLNPGWWLIGAGVECAYLLGLAGNRRFQRLVDAKALAGTKADYSGKISAALDRLPPEDQARYRGLNDKCRGILASDPDAREHSEGLANLTWLFLNLLQARHAVRQMVRNAEKEERDEGSLADRLAGVEQRLAGTDLQEDLRRSLESRRDILRRREETLAESRQKLAHAEAELARIEEQTALLRDQSLMSREPAALSREIDRISDDLSGTSTWMREQRSLFTEIEAMSDQPPAAALFETER